MSTTVDQITAVVPPEICQSFLVSQRSFYDKNLQNHTVATKKKFDRLIRTLVVHTNDKLPIEKPKAVHNGTSTVLPVESEVLFSLGPKFALPITDFSKVPYFHLIADIESILKTNTDPMIRDRNRCGIANIVQNHVYQTANRSTQWDPLTVFCERAQRVTRTFLKTNQDVIVVNADKGNKTVVMKTDDYKQKMRILLDDPKTYKPVPRDPTSGFQRKNNTFVERLVNLKLIDRRTATQLKSQNALCPRIYGLPKAHKPGLPLRPVVPNMTAPTYELSKFVGRIIQSSIQSSYNIKDSFEFCDFINTVTLPHGYVLVSLDVVSLFTCIPKDLVCHDVISYWERIKPHAKNICLDLFLELVEFCIDASFFKFDGQHYVQIFGTAMGNPLSPIVSDLVTEALLDTVVKQLEVDLPFIRKYVDDLVTALPIDHLQHVLDKFNGYNPNIQFTCEVEVNNRLPFLDMLLVRHGDQHISTEWYQKPIASGRFLNYLSAHPPHQKINMAVNFIARVNRLSRGVSEAAKVEVMDQHLKLNDYPKSLRHRLINRRNCRDNGRRTNAQSDTEDQQSTFRSIAYVPHLTDKISKFLQKDYTNVKLATRNTNTAKQYYTQTKDKVAKDDQSNVIYSIPCGGCNSQYIGMTTNKLKTRISGHKSNINELEKLRNTETNTDDPQYTTLSEKTALLDHCIKTEHTFNLHEAKILDRHKNPFSLQFLEVCHIAKNNDTVVNKRTDTAGLSVVYAGLFHSFQNNNKPHTRNTANGDSRFLDEF